MALLLYGFALADRINYWNYLTQSGVQVPTELNAPRSIVSQSNTMKRKAFDRNGLHGWIIKNYLKKKMTI